MRVTDVKIKLAQGDDKLLAFASVTFDDCFVVRDIKVIRGTKGVFVAPEKDEAEIVLNVAKDAKVGLRQDMIVSGLMRANNQSIVRYARAIPVVVVAK